MGRRLFNGRRAAQAGIALGLAAGAGLLLAKPASATITGPCTATGYASSSKLGPKEAAAGGASSITLKDNGVWHVSKNSYLSGTGSSTVEQTSVTVNVAVFGFNIPIINSSGKGYGGSAGPYSVATWSSLAHTAYVSGASTSCSGYVQIVIDDNSPATTAVGGGGLAATAVGGIGVGAVGLRRRGL